MSAEIFWSAKIALRSLLSGGLFFFYAEYEKPRSKQVSGLSSLRHQLRLQATKFEL
jgi:hypothetical protein